MVWNRSFHVAHFIFLFLAGFCGLFSYILFQLKLSKLKIGIIWAVMQEIVSHKFFTKPQCLKLWGKTKNGSF